MKRTSLLLVVTAFVAAAVSTSVFAADVVPGAPGPVVTGYHHHHRHHHHRRHHHYAQPGANPGAAPAGSTVIGPATR